MTNHAQYTPGPASAAQVCRYWSPHMDALDRHLSSKMWGLAAVSVMMIAYPIARIVIPAVLHSVVPDVVRIVLNLT